MLCMVGFLTLCLSCLFVSVCVCVRYQNISKNIESINFNFGGSLPSDPGRNPFNFEKKLPQGKGGCGGSKFGLNEKR